jgi:aurora kinase, other
LAKNRGQLTEPQCANYIFQIASALHHMHSRCVYHRDLKPENVFIGHDGRLQLGDFGSAIHAPSPKSLRYTLCGTPEYLSPEMIASVGHDASLDCWSLGIMMYEILFGR